MNRRAIAVALVVFAVPAAAEVIVYNVEPVHSQPQWEARHIGMSTQRGSFGKMTGKVMLDTAAKTGSVDVTIDATSAKTFDPRLDQIVKGERFFNVEKYPTMTFKSNKFTFDGDKVVEVEGDLTMVGVTKPVTFKVANFVCGEQPFNKKPMCGADATATIKRSDWGITDGLKMSNPSDEIKLVIPIEGYREGAP